jgi:hypothetical protein
MRVHLLLVRFCLAAAVLPLAAWAAAPGVTAVRTAVPPVIDGTLADPAWQNARWQSDFTLLGDETPAAPATRFALLYDDRTLYFAARCTEPKLDQLKAAVTQRDALHLYSDDVVELFVAPGPQRTDYYQFEINSTGVVADAVAHQSGTVRDASWNCAVQVATAKGDGEWIVEMAVPLTELELGDNTPGDWGLNVARVRRAGGSEQLSSFVRMTGTFHQPALFAALALPGSEFDALRWEVPPPTGLSVLRENEATVVKGKLSVKNLGAQLRPMVLTPRLRQGGKAGEAKPVLDILDAGQSKTYEFALPLPGEGPQEFTVELADRREPQALFARRSFAVDLAFTPLSLTLREPAYQSAIYATQKIKRISGSLRVALSAQELAGVRAVVSLSPLDAAAQPLAETAVEQLSPEVAFSLPIPALAEGRYRLRVELLGDKGQKMHGLERIIRKLPPAPGGVEWRITENGILLRNEQPFLPVGWYSLPAEALKAAASNVSWLYMGPWQTVEALRKALDEIGAAGGYAMIYPTVNNQGPNELAISPISGKDMELIRQRVRALKDHPALLGWYLADEPEYHRVLPESLQQLRTLISEEDPWHPTIVVNNAFGAIRQFAQSGDVIAPDPYPFFKRGGMSPSMGKVGAFIAEAAAAALPGQAVWVVAQAHDTRDFGGKGERAPTFVESRNMVWQAVSAGARGVVWWDWNWVFPNTIDSVIGNAYLARELNALKAYVLAPITGGLEVTAPQREMVRAALRTADGQHALFAANAATTEQEVVFRAPALAGRELVVVGEGRTLKVADDGEFADRFAPYGTHLYVTDPAFATSEPLAAVQKKIDAANAARTPPGNLAFEDSGVIPSASSQGQYQPTPFWLIDGVRDGRGWQALPFQGADWIELAWPKPQKIGRVVLYTDAIADCAVQVAQGDDATSAWRNIAAVKDAATHPLEVSFAPVEATRLRIQVSRLRGGIQATRVWEIETYEK